MEVKDISNIGNLFRPILVPDVADVIHWTLIVQNQ